MSRKPLLIVGAVALVGVGFAIGYFVAESPGWVFWSEASESTETVRVYGNIELRDAQLSFRVSEYVTQVLVEEGDPVEKGQTLATLDPTRLRASLTEAQARLEAQRALVRRLENGTRPQELAQARALVRAAETRLANVERQVARLRETVESGATSDQALDDAEAARDQLAAELEVQQKALELAVEGPREEDVAQARARLDEFEASVARLQVEFDQATLTSPSRGTVQSRAVEPGELATPGRAVLSIALTDEKWVRAYLPEPQLGRVAPGTSASVTTDSFPGQPFEGRVGFISPTAEFTPKSVQTTELRPQLVYEVRIHVEDPDNRLRLGQPVTVDIEANAAPDER